MANKTANTKPVAKEGKTAQANKENKIIRRLSFSFPVGPNDGFADEGATVSLQNSRLYRIIRKDFPEDKKYYFISAVKDDPDGYHEFITSACIDMDNQTISTETMSIFGIDIEAIIPAKISFKEVHKNVNLKRKQEARRSGNICEFICTVNGKTFSIASFELVKITPIAGFGYPFMGYITDIDDDGNMTISKVKVAEALSVSETTKSIEEVYGITRMEMNCEDLSYSIVVGGDSSGDEADDDKSEEDEGVPDEAPESDDADEGDTDEAE